VKILDISPLINSDLAVFPGDTPFERQIAMSFSNGDHLELSSISGTLHLGAHADSSGHYHAKGEGIEKRDIQVYLGKCQVIQVPLRPGERISTKDIAEIEIKAPRILFRTESFPNPYKWNEDFMSLSPELIEALGAKACVLVGIDTPSIDPANSKDLESHQAIFKTKMAVLEGLVLDQVSPGLYDLIALPLAIEGADASPVRAVLLDLSFSEEAFGKSRR